MRRCGVFVLFNEKGIVEPYVEILIRSIQEFLTECIVIVNGEINKEEKKKLHRYSKRVFQRCNIGYDGGAYKDIFLKFLKDEEWSQWDEIVLMNDTFYGPFFPWDRIFEVMEKEEKCDFWGLSSHHGGIEENLFGQQVISPHVQSYFLVIKKRMFMNSAFLAFWNELQYPKDFKEAVKNFEIHFSEYFSKKGFRYSSWLDIQNKQHNEKTIFEMIMKRNFPIMKRKAVMIQDYIRIKKLVRFLEKNQFYPVDAIKEDVIQRCLMEKMKPYNPIKLIEFCYYYKNIYLFGKGEYAKNIKCFLEDNGKKIKGYVVSRVQEENQQIYELRKFVIQKDEGIIIALSKKNYMEVYKDIQKKIPMEQLMIPEYDY